MRLFDTHCHLGDVKLKPQVGEILARAHAASVQAVCVICADPTNIRSFDTDIPAMRALQPSMQILRSAGLHPHEAKHWCPELESLIEAQLKNDASGVGETGLDYHYSFSTPEQQQLVFNKHIDWACEFKKPLIIHCREAISDVLKALDRDDVRRLERPGILHCFTEDRAAARELLDRGFMISFSGIVTFNNAEEIRAVAKMVPDDRLLIETDAPYLAPKPHRGKLNEPAFVSDTANFVAELRSTTPDALAEITWTNACHIFSVKEPS